MGCRAEDEVAQVVVDEPVVHDPPGLAPLHRPTFTEEPQLVGQGRHAHPEHQGDVADAQLVFGDRKKVDDPCSRGVGERREEVPDGASPVAPQGSPEERSDRLGMEAFRGAGVPVDLGCKHLSHHSSIVGGGSAVDADRLGAVLTGLPAHDRANENKP